MAVDAAAVIAVAGEMLVDLVPSGVVVSARPGGSPANTAVALARLGVPVTMVARFADDDYGRLLREHLRSHGIDLSFAVAAAGRSSAARVSRGPDGSATYEFDIDGTVDWDWTADELPALPEPIVAVHTGSLALARSDALETWTRGARSTATVSIDPNLRPQLVTAETRPRVEGWVAFADIVKVSVEDLQLAYPDEPAYDVARRWSRAGPGLVVVTEGVRGATAFSGHHETHRDAVHVDVVDTIGAGDVFTAGLLQVLLERGRLGGRLESLTRDDVDAALTRATVVAAMTCTRTGADPPTLRELRAR